MRTPAIILAGALASVVMGGAAGLASGNGFVRPLALAADKAIAAARGGDVTAVFALGRWPSRHPLLTGGEDLAPETRARVARAVGGVAGVGGVHWADSAALARRDPAGSDPLHCQQSVEGLLKTRSIRFAEGSAALLPASEVLVDEVAAALRPCSGALIAIEGHTDLSGREEENRTLSLERARTVREALVRRGLPRDTLYASGLGAEEPVADLAPGDPANRRIEFSVIRQDPLTPTPIDTPGAY